MREITVRELRAGAVEDGEIEYVERKGIGHPDTLIDGIVESTSIELSKEYVKEFGIILHHNVDKGLIIGGSSNVKFGGGVVNRSIEVIVTGRATEEFQGRRIDVNGIAKRVTAEYLKKHTRFLDVENEVKIDSKIFRGSADLNGVFMRGSGMPLANDTSFGMGFAPFSETERLTLETERYLNSSAYKEKMPAVGEDIKVMGMRRGDRINLTLAIAFVAGQIKDIEEYESYKEKVVKDVILHSKKITDKEVNIKVNTGDSIERGEVYITKTGLSCESGDDGSVGRGNRVNGLITPFRRMSLEAAAGKNPVNHVGKIYNVLATALSQNVVKDYPEVRECDIAILSEIGTRIDTPSNLDINLALEKGKSIESIRGKVNYIAEGWLERIGELTSEISLGKYTVF
ncbi:MAG: methionine adenosyltransferase [Candidatus Micrarchaeia archaeon]